LTSNNHSTHNKHIIFPSTTTSGAVSIGGNVTVINTNTSFIDDNNTTNIHNININSRSRNGSSSSSSSFSSTTKGIMDQSSGSRNNSDKIRYECGYCTKLGPRSTNEDRFVCLPNIYGNAIEDNKNNNNNNSMRGGSNSSSINHIFNYNDNNNSDHTKNRISGSSTSSYNIHVDQLMGGGSDESIGYFAVFDGHGGHETAEYLQHHLLDSVYSHASFYDDIDNAIIETCIKTDLTILVRNMN